MNDFWRWYLQQWQTASADAHYYGHQLAVAIADRLTLGNFFKVGLLLFLLWLTLRIIGRVNGIKGNDTWAVQVNQVHMAPRYVRLSRGTIRRNGEPINETSKDFEGRSGIVEFHRPVPYRPWLNKLGIGQRSGYDSRGYLPRIASLRCRRAAQLYKSRFGLTTLPRQRWRLLFMARIWIVTTKPNKLRKFSPAPTLP
jgi:hypothetical protein